MKKLYCMVALIVCLLVDCSPLFAQNAITIWKNGVPTTILESDSVFFWADNGSGYDGNQENNDELVLTDVEEYIQSLPSDEESCGVITYSEEDSLRYDEYAQVVLDLIRYNDAPPVYLPGPRRASDFDDMAEDAIRNNGINIFSGLQIEQQDWNCGNWGKTRYGGFDCCYNTFKEGGRRKLMVVFYHKGGFPNAKTAYLKLGQVNTGKIVTGNGVTISPSKEYGFIVADIDDFLPQGTNGCINFFPLLISVDSKARNYLNPIMVKTDPLIASDWRDKWVGYEFGRINGVPVYFNNDSKKGNSNVGDGKYQCVELCKRYVIDLNSVDRKYSDAWGNAIQWPANRQDDSKDPGKYMVFANDGNTQVREGDLFVYKYGDYGHIGVVIKVTPNYISVAHQNAGKGTYCKPIGTTLCVENGVVLDKSPSTGRSPIYASQQEIVYFIRMNSSAESYSSYSRRLECNTTNVSFASTAVGTTATQTITLTNRGYSALTVSDIKLSRGRDFSVNKTNFPISAGGSVSVTITFKPTSEGELTDRLVIKSDADDNPTWVISLSGRATGNANAYITVPDVNLMAYLLENFDQNGDGKISQTEAYDVTEIKCENRNISSVRGLEQFPNLSWLDCSGNPLGSIDVSEMQNLWLLSCKNTNISRIDVSKNRYLGHLYCDNNNLTTLDFSMCPYMTRVDCFNNKLISIKINPGLYNLSCSRNQLSSIDVSQAYQLCLLACSDNKLTKINASNCPMSILNCDGNPITSLDCTHWEDLYQLLCYDTQLTSLDLSKSDVSGTVWLAPNDKLMKLYVSKGQVIHNICGEGETRNSYYIPDHTQIIER